MREKKDRIMFSSQLQETMFHLKRFYPPRSNGEEFQFSSLGALSYWIKVRVRFSKNIAFVFV